MENAKNQKPEKQILQELKGVHQTIKKDPEKSYDPDELKPTLDGLSQQLKGSDADSDKSLGQDIGKSKKLKDSEGSDADRNE